MESNSRITINTGNIQDLEAEATSSDNTNTYLSKDKNTSAGSLILQQRATTINNYELDNLENLFTDVNLTMAKDIYNKLINEKQLPDFKKTNLFFELYSLAKPEHKHLFKIQPSTDGYQLSIANQLTLEITNGLIISYLTADIENISTSIIDIIKNEHINLENDIKNLSITTKNLETIPQNTNNIISEILEDLGIIKKHLTINASDQYITLLLQLINFNIVNKNASLQDSLSINKNFSLLFNNNSILFSLLANKFTESLKYTVKNLIINEKINLDASLCHECLFDKRFYAEYSKNLLIASTHQGADIFRSLYENTAIDEEIAKTILFSDDSNYANIPTDIYLNLFSKLDASSIANFKPSARDLDLLFNRKYNFTSNANQSTDENQIKQYLLLSCTILQNLEASSLSDLNKEHIINNFKDIIIFYNTSLYDKFLKDEQAIIDTFIHKLIPLICGDITDLSSIDNNTQILDTFLSILDRITPEQKYNFYVKNHNSFFVLLATSIIAKFATRDTTIVDKAKKLYNNYLNLYNLKELVTSDDFNFLFGIDGKLEWDSIESFNILFVKDNLAILINYLYLKSVLLTDKTDINTKWDNFFLFEDNKNIPIHKYGLENIFKNYLPVFYKKYQEYQSQLLLSNFIKLLDLGEYEKYFIDESNIEGKLDLSLKEHEDYLATGFNKFIEGNKDKESDYLFTISDKHLTDIKSACQITNSNNDVVAKYLVCLAYLFVYYSSQKKFGTSNTSPLPLRSYASALLQKAYELDKNCIIPDDRDNSFTSWQNKLLGVTVAYSCTDCLSGNMLNYLKDKYPHNILEKILPISSLQ